MNGKGRTKKEKEEVLKEKKGGTGIVKNKKKNRSLQKYLE